MGLFSSIGSALGTAANVISGGLSGFSTGGWLGAAGGAISGLGAGVSSANSAAAMREGIELQNAANKEAAQTQMNFQTRSYLNRYQWQKQDLERAGLNPMLAYQQGAGNSLQGAQYQAQNVEAGTPEAINSAYNNFRTSIDTKAGIQGLDHQRAQIGVTKAEENRVKIDSELKHEQKTQTWALGSKAFEESRRARVENDILKENLHSARAAAVRADVEADFWHTAEGRALIKTDLIGRSLSPAASSAKSLKGLTR